MKRVFYFIVLWSAARCALACGLWYPLNYFIQESPIIIEGKIESIEADIPDEDGYHHNLIHIKVADVLKNDSDMPIEAGGEFTFKGASKKDPETSATIYYEEGWEGIWFFNFYPEPVNETWVAARYFSDKKESIAHELSLPYKRKYLGNWYTLTQIQLGRGNESGTRQLPMRYFALYLHETIKNYSTIPNFEVDVFYPSDLAEKPVKILKRDDDRLDDYLQRICQENGVDFEYIEKGIRFFSREPVDKAAL